MTFNARPVDPRDVTMEVTSPRFRVYFWRLANGASREFEVDGADVTEVLAWADSACEPDETYTLHVIQALGDELVLTRISSAGPDEPAYRVP